MSSLATKSNREDWHVECVSTDHYAIFHKQVNLEWTDAQGDNLFFESEGEALEYLNRHFNTEA